MKFGCCTSPDNIEALVKAGYDFIDFNGAAVAAMTEEAFADLLKKFAGSGLFCGGFHASVPPKLKLAGIEKDAAALDAHFRLLAGRARDLKCPRIGLGSPLSRGIGPGVDPKAYSEDFLRTYKSALKIAADYGVAVLLEALRPADTNFINKQSEALAVLKLAGEKNTGLVLDLFHFIENGETPAEITPEIAERTGYLHIAEPGGRGYPRLGNLKPYQPAVDRLKALGYAKDLVAIEAPTADFAAGHKEGLQALRELFRAWV